VHVFHGFLFLVKLRLLLPYDFEILKLPHQLIHLHLLYPDELLQTVHLGVLLSDPLLCAVQLLAVAVHHLLLELLDVLLEVVVLDLHLLLGDVQLLLQELLLRLQLPLRLDLLLLVQVARRETLDVLARVVLLAENLHFLGFEGRGGGLRHSRVAQFLRVLETCGEFSCVLTDLRLLEP